MPANKYTRSLYKTGTVASEKAAIANRDPARKKAAEKIMKREGTTSPSGGRTQAVLRITKDPPNELKPANPNKPLVRQTCKSFARPEHVKPTPTARNAKVPLVKSPSKAAFRKNIKAEVNAGKPVKQAVAIAYSVKRESAKKGKK
jgi:hypothetical protein